MTGARVAVVTVVAGRHEHLREQRAQLANSVLPADLHVVVAIDDPHVTDVLVETPEIPTVVVHEPTTCAGLPVAAARNAGAAAAIAEGVDTLVFLDVDCIPDRALLGELSAAIATRPDALVCGTVTYLPPAPRDGWSTTALRAARRPHAARPDPAPRQLAALAPELFWSLCFAVDVDVWRTLDGFYAGYVGYGAEDTDLGFRANAQNTPILIAGGADAFHQHHPVSEPPVEHLDDILRNGAVFRRRHGRSPMGGWLDAFVDTGLVDADRSRRTDATRVASIPPVHPYVDAVTPPTVVRVDPDRVRGWEPDPLFTPGALRARCNDIDVVHLHFGYDRMSQDELHGWLRELSDVSIPLVVTVHDLRNPHHATRERHDDHLRLLLAAADEVLTLTDAAADELRDRYGRRPRVLSHPTLVDSPVLERTQGSDHVLVPLKALRRNVLEPVAVLDAVRDGASRAGLRTRVLIEPGALEDPRVRGLDRSGVELDVSPYLPHADVVARVAAARACVLPYRFGTHSGWIELCRDVGTRVVAPDCGHYGAQWHEVLGYRNNERHGLDAASLRGAVFAAATRPLPAPPRRRDREAQRDQIVAAHDELYRRVARR